MLTYGTIIEGKYKVTGLIGHGGMSSVYSAQDLITGRMLAIKEANRQGEVDNRTAELSLGAEGKLLKQLSHSHLPRIYDIIETNNNIMIVMDYVEGQSLDKALVQHGAMPMDKVIEWSIQVCDVLHYLHTQNPPIIYRDMKPANLILQPNGNIMLIDFGTARTWKINMRMTSDTVLFGTEGFAAPEQFGGLGQSDARTDIFCLGATIFNLVTNHNPYLKPYGITPLGNWDPAMTDCPLDRIIKKCTAKDPNDRFQTAMELKEALSEAYSNPHGKSSLFGLLGKTAKIQNKSWQKVVLERLDGMSGQLSRGQTSKNRGGGTEQQRGTVKAPENTSEQKTYKSGQQVVPKDQRNQGLRTRDNVYEAVTTNEPIKKEVSIYLMLLIVCVSGGIALSIIGIIAMMMSSTAGIVVMALAIASLSGGVFCALKYVNEGQ